MTELLRLSSYCGNLVNLVKHYANSQDFTKSIQMSKALDSGHKLPFEIIHVVLWHFVTKIKNQIRVSFQLFNL